MAKHKIPKFLSPLPKEDKDRLMKDWIHVKDMEVIERYVSHLEGELDQLLREEERNSPISWFEFKWNKAKRIGHRLALRKQISDLKG